MTIYNTAWQVVDLIEADSPNTALDRLAKRLQAAGFELVEDTGDAFESDDQGVPK